MTRQKALTIIAAISFFGILFSGFLSYQELFADGCSLQFISCGTRNIQSASLPACVYGLVMYLIVFITSLLGLRSKK